MPLTKNIGPRTETVSPTFRPATLATFSNLQSLPGMFGTAGFSTMTINTSAQTMFENVANVAGLNVGDTVSVRGPMFLVSGTPTVVCAKVLKR